MITLKITLHIDVFIDLSRINCHKFLVTTVLAFNYLLGIGPFMIYKQSVSFGNLAPPY